VNRVLVLCPDHVKRQMSGPAIRYFELSHQLHRAGHEVVLATPATPDLEPQPFEIITSDPVVLQDLCRRQDVLVMQGYILELFPFLRDAGAAIVCDLYCPFYLELLVDRQHNPDPDLAAPLESLRVTLDPIRQSDFLICASEKQRDYWLGVLTALNRVNADTYAMDPTLRALIDTVPFGLPDEPPHREAPAMRGVIPGIGEDDYVVLWGSSIYNWFDPLSLIRAVAGARERVPEIRLVVMATRHASPNVTAETWMLHEARRLSAELGLTGRNVFFNEGWVPYEHRADWLLEADVGASVHLQHIETHFSFRVRFLDYLWAQLPILCTRGDVLAEAVERERIGVTVDPGDVDGLTAALVRLADPGVREEYRSRVAAYAARMTWSRAAEPLVRFCDAPWSAPDLGRVSPLRALPVPLRDYSRRDWRYYAVRAMHGLVHEGPLALAARGSRFVGRRLGRRRALQV